MVKLIDITGKALSGEWGLDDDTGDGIPVLRTTNFTNEGTVNFSNVVTRKINKKDLSKKYLRKGDIIIEKSGGSDEQPVGRVIFFDGDENKYLFNNFTGLLRVSDQSKWLPKYVFYALFSNYIQGGTRPFENKTTGLHNLKTDSYVESFEIKAIPLGEQRITVNQLDRVNELISLRKQQLSKLDELVKARFVELFGDFIQRSNKVFLEEISDFVTVGIANSATHAYADSGIVMLRNQNIKENYLDENDLIYITPDFAKKYGSKQLAENDILVIRTGYPGVACLVPKKYKGCQTFTTLIVRLKDVTQAHANYVCYYINSSFGKDYVEQSKVGVAQQNFGAKALAKMPIAVPPVELQKQFAAFVEQTDKSKLTVQQSLDKLEILKKALMQKYFG